METARNSLPCEIEAKNPNIFYLASISRGRQNFQLPASAAFAAWKGQYKSENPVDKARTYRVRT